MPTQFIRLDSVYNGPEGLKHFLREQERSASPRLSIPPVFRRNGFYYDRRTKLAWVECEGVAWTESANHFLRNLREEGTRQLSRAETAAIRTLLHLDNCSDALRAQLTGDRFRQEIRWNHYRVTSRLRAFAHKHQIVLRTGAARYADTGFAVFDRAAQALADAHKADGPSAIEGGS